MPYYGFAFCDTHLKRLIEGGNFPAPIFLSPRKRFWTFEMLTAYEAIVVAGFKWRNWAVTQRPLAEVEQWIAEQQAKLLPKQHAKRAASRKVGRK